jgi:hypothetical protein
MTGRAWYGSHGEVAGRRPPGLLDVIRLLLVSVVGLARLAASAGCLALVVWFAWTVWRPMGISMAVGGGIGILMLALNLVADARDRAHARAVAATSAQPSGPDQETLKQAQRAYGERYR